MYFRCLKYEMQLIPFRYHANTNNYHTKTNNYHTNTNYHYPRDLHLQEDFRRIYVAAIIQWHHEMRGFQLRSSS